MASTAIPLDQHLSQAQRLLEGLEANWRAEHEKVLSSRPLWQDALKAHSPEWAGVMGAAMGWLDHAPAILMNASLRMTDDALIAGYAKISKSLESLLEDVSSPGKGTWFKSSSNPQERLGVIAEEKNALDQKSKDNLRALRSALDLGEDIRALAAVVGDALPDLQTSVRLELEALQGAAPGSLFETQKRARDIKIQERAAAALHLVSDRIGSEFQEDASDRRAQLERMAQEEEHLHVRLDALIMKITHQVARMEMGAQATEKSVALSSLANEKKGPLDAPETGNAIAKVERGPNYPGATSKVSPEAKKWLNMLCATPKEKNYIGSTNEVDIFFWRNLSNAMKDPSVNALTVIPDNGELLVNFIVKNKTQGGSLDAKRIGELLDRIIPDFDRIDPSKTLAEISSGKWYLGNRSNRALRITDIDWAGIEAVAKASSFGAHQYIEEGLRLLVRVAKVAAVPGVHTLATSGGGLFNHLSKAIEENFAVDKDLMRDIRWTLRTHASPDDLERQMTPHMGAGHSSFHFSRLAQESEHLGHDFRTRVLVLYFNSILNKSDRYDAAAFVAHLNPRDTRLIAEAASQGLAKELDTLIPALLSTNKVKQALDMPLGEENAWAYRLREAAEHVKPVAKPLPRHLRRPSDANWPNAPGDQGKTNPALPGRGGLKT